MRKSRELSNILDDCLERVLFQGETLEQCLERFPEYADKLKPLLETALAVRRASAVQPRSEFREMARNQLRLSLQGMTQKHRRSFFSWNGQPRWATVVTIALALLLAGSGTMAAANNSMPDEPLYPVKLATEQMQLVFTFSSLGKAERYAKLADSRVLEIARMADKNRPEQIERAAQRLEGYFTKIADLSSTRGVMPSVARAPPGGEVPAVKGAPPLAEQAKEAGLSFDPRARLRTTVVRNAIDHPAKLRALLKTVPESARPALLRAIVVSETGYEEALRSLDDN